MNPLKEHLFNQQEINKVKNTMSIIAALTLGIITGIIICGWIRKLNEEDDYDSNFNDRKAA